MNDVLIYILKQIYLKIPREVLIEAFQPGMESLDYAIKKIIIFDIVLRSCNLFAGKLTKIKLKTSYSIRVNADDYPFPLYDGNYTLYRIPPEVRANRDIVAAIDIAYPLGQFSAYGYSPEVGSNTIASLTNEVLSSNTHSPQYLTPVPIAMDDNIIKLDPPQAFHVDWIVSCMVKYDENFNNITPNMYKSLGEMSLNATKMYIYNKLMIPISQGFLVGGKNLEAIKFTIEKYDDAEDKFNEALKHFRGAATFSKDNLVDLISLMV